ncbi:MAG TPA: TetR family transcriptional regulator [Acidimicrobiales bacterium]|jgi:AcrR family transcriptional regulator|nr:TetR family transcriptional regulator [Acidimicrobiales bacterium]
MTGVTAPTQPRRVGRPARIDKDAIAEAVLQIGLDKSSMKAVADHLGVSVPGLYHHVRNRKELLLLAAQRSMAQMQLPSHEGKHWSEWLREWGRYSRNAFIEEPEVLGQYLSGAVSWERVVEVTDSVIRVLTAQGFTPASAMAAWDVVGGCAVGSAVTAIRYRTAVVSGHPPNLEWRRVLDGRPPDELLGARAVLEGFGENLEVHFDEELTTLLVGIAVRRGEPAEVVLSRHQVPGSAP